VLQHRFRWAPKSQTKKKQAAIKSVDTLMMGGPPEIVIARYCKHVALNIKRLTLP
jgi:hypothetical protein